MSKPSYDNLYSRSAEQTLVAAALLRGAQVFEDRTVQRLLPRHFKDAQCRAAWKVRTPSMPVRAPRLFTVLHYLHRGIPVFGYVCTNCRYSIEV